MWEQKLKLHFNLSKCIPLHFMIFCVNDFPEIFFSQARKGNWHSSTKSGAQMSGSCAEAGGDKGTVCLAKLRVHLSQA